MKHTHHIIPKHAGGTDDPENLTELTVEEHAEAHRLLFEQYGRWQDRLAWLALSGKTTFSEAKRVAASIGFFKHLSSEMREAYRERAIQMRKEGKLANIGDIMRGKPFDEKHKEKLSDIAKNRDKIICDLCGVAVIKQMYVRWHGEGKCDAAPDLESPKVCKGCGETKALKVFAVSGKKQNGHKIYKSFCFSCENARRRNRRAST